MFKRFNEWSVKRKISDILTEISKISDREWTFLDSAIVKAHQHSSGAAHGAESAIGKSVAGNTSKIHLAVDSFGLPFYFEVTGGQVHDCKVAPELVANISGVEWVIADKDF